MLHLDILSEAVQSLEDALKFFAAPESLEGYKAPSSKVRHRLLVAQANDLYIFNDVCSDTNLYLLYFTHTSIPCPDTCYACSYLLIMWVGNFGQPSEVVSASKAIKIQSLPPVLIVHFMRFSYGASGSGKLNKAVKYADTLTIGRELLASSTGLASEVRSASPAFGFLNVA